MGNENQSADGKLPLFQGYEPSIIEREGYISEPSLNIPWLVAISSQMGNAYTAALSRTANVFSEPEYGWESVGFNQNWQGAAGRAAVGGISIWW